jgi:hypothetical protein
MINSKVKKEILGMNQRELRAFILDRGAIDDYDHRDAQEFALDCLIEDIQDEARRQGAAEFASRF